jgi:hypothetical protein
MRIRWTCPHSGAVTRRLGYEHDVNSGTPPRVGLLWRREWDPPGENGPNVETCRLHGVFAAFSELGVEAEPVVYSDESVDSVREQLLRLDGVLVWVNPIEKGLDRSRLDPLLREVAASGVFVSAHPDVILRLGTKEVLVDTRSMSCGTDTHVYRTWPEFRQTFPERLAARGPLVLKQHRGMGGEGVWKVERLERETVIAQHAADGAQPERVALADFVARCEPYFSGTGLLVEQPYQERLPEGMIRAYLTHDRVVGFTHQHPRGLLPPNVDAPPSAKVFEPPTEPAYRVLRLRIETEWVPELRRILGLQTAQLPVIWDLDFLYGPRTDDGEDTYVLCEINASSTFAFPEFAMPGVARATVERARVDREARRAATPDAPP